MNPTLKRVRRLNDEIYSRAIRNAYEWIASLTGDDKLRCWREAFWPAVRDRWPPCDVCPMDLPYDQRAAYLAQLTELPTPGTYESLLAEVAAINAFREKLEAERLEKMERNGKK